MIWLIYKYFFKRGPSWSWCNNSWIYNYLCNQCLSPPKLWIRTRWWRDVLNTTFYDSWQWFASGLCELLSQTVRVGIYSTTTEKSRNRNLAKVVLAEAIEIKVSNIYNDLLMVWNVFFYSHFNTTHAFTLNFFSKNINVWNLYFYSFS
jgi:hypothetical protein